MWLHLSRPCPLLTASCPSATAQALGRLAVPWCRGPRRKRGIEGKRKCRQQESPLQPLCLGQGLAEHPLPPSIPAARGGGAGAHPQLLSCPGGAWCTWSGHRGNSGAQPGIRPPPRHFNKPFLSPGLKHLPRGRDF